MIAKIMKPEAVGAFKGLIEYHEKHGAELLETGNFPEQDTKLLQQAFEFVSEQNTRCKNPTFHAVLSFARGEVLNDELYKSIAADYMQGMGYGEQPYGVWLHTDTDIMHLHIVSTRININDNFSKISDSNERKRSNILRRQLEQKYRLQQAEKSQQQQSYTRQLNEAVAQAMVQRPRSIAQLTKLLAESGVEVREATNQKTGKRQGYVFRFNDSGKKKGIASSKLPCFATVSLMKQIMANKAAHKAAQAYLRKTLTFALKTAKSTDELTAALKQKNIGTQLHQNARGIYGISFTYKEATLKGSEVGKPFTWERISAALEQNAANSGGAAPQQHFVPISQPIILAGGSKKKKKKRDDDDEDDDDDVTGLRNRRIKR